MEEINNEQKNHPTAEDIAATTLALALGAPDTITEFERALIWKAAKKGGLTEAKKTFRDVTAPDGRN